MILEVLKTMVNNTSNPILIVIMFIIKHFGNISVIVISMLIFIFMKLFEYIIKLSRISKNYENIDKMINDNLLKDIANYIRDMQKLSVGSRLGKRDPVKVIVISSLVVISQIIISYVNYTFIYNYMQFGSIVVLLVLVTALSQMARDIDFRRLYKFMKIVVVLDNLCGDNSEYLIIVKLGKGNYFLVRCKTLNDLVQAIRECRSLSIFYWLSRRRGAVLVDSE